MFTLRTARSFKMDYERITEHNEVIKKRVMKTLQKLSQDPHGQSLRSHKVNTPHHGVRWSSWVTGDMRIIWDYDSSEQLVIILLDIGGHSGSRKVDK